MRALVGLTILITLFAMVAPLWVAVLASSLLFGWAHIYQGYAGVARVTVIGLVMAGVYLLSGSIWVPVAVHALADIIQFQMAREVIASPEMAVAV